MVIHLHKTDFVCIGNTLISFSTLFSIPEQKQLECLVEHLRHQVVYTLDIKLTEYEVIEVRQTFYTTLKARRRLSPDPHQRLRTHDAKNAGGKGEVLRKSWRMRRRCKKNDSIIIRVDLNSRIGKDWLFGGLLC